MNKPMETRTVSATGGQKGAKDIRLGGADAAALVELGRVYGMGEKKYARFNYLRGYPWSLSIDAAFRHLLAFMGGEAYDECSMHPGLHDDPHMAVYDPETCDGSGLLHSAHVAWHGLTLTAFIQRGVGEDDRFKPIAMLPSTQQNIDTLAFAGTVFQTGDDGTTLEHEEPDQWRRLCMDGGHHVGGDHMLVCPDYR